MTLHEQFDEDIALHALGALAGSGQAALEQHLESCLSCQSDLRNLRNDAAWLALSLIDQPPPPRLRRRLLRTIAHEHRGQVNVSKRSAFWFLVPYIVSGAVLIVATLVWKEDRHLNHALSNLEQRNSEAEEQLKLAQNLIDTLTSRDAEEITLVPVNTLPQPQGKAYYLSARGHLIFFANNLHPLPPQKTYELWLIPASGSPIAAGTFQPDSLGRASIMNPPLPAGTHARTFAITIEPYGGSPAPTSHPILLGDAG